MTDWSENIKTIIYNYLRKNIQTLFITTQLNPWSMLFVSALGRSSLNKQKWMLIVET